MERDAAVATWRRVTASCHAKQQQLAAAEVLTAAAAAAASGDTAAEGTGVVGGSSDIEALKVGAKLFGPG
jgi:hypothetical protein